MVKFDGKIGKLYQIFTPCTPLRNLLNVQTKGGGGQRPFEQCSKKLHFSLMSASLSTEILNFLIPKILILMDLHF